MNFFNTQKDHYNAIVRVLSVLGFGFVCLCSYNISYPDQLSSAVNIYAFLTIPVLLSFLWGGSRVKVSSFAQSLGMMSAITVVELSRNLVISAPVTLIPLLVINMICAYIFDVYFDPRTSTEKSQTISFALMVMNFSVILNSEIARPIWGGIALVGFYMTFIVISCVLSMNFFAKRSEK